MGDPSAPSRGGGDDDEWEICNDNGFVFKRRRLRLRLRPGQEAAEGPSPAEDPETELRRHRRARRRRCLLDLRDRYRRELEQWERLSFDLFEGPSAATAPSSQPQPPAVAPLEPSGGDTQQLLIDDLLSQVEAQDAILQKLSEVCDYAESLCREKEESLVESLMELRIWGSPRSLITSLTD